MNKELAELAEKRRDEEDLQSVYAQHRAGIVKADDSREDSDGHL
jgi:molybdopterin synthase catalytic subunit